MTTSKSPKQVKKDWTYLMNYSCQNCDEHFTQEFPFGQVASQGVCPNCGVSPKQLEKPKYDYISDKTYA